MKHSTKILMTVAGCMMAIGLLLSGVTYAFSGGTVYSFPIVKDNDAQGFNLGFISRIFSSSHSSAIKLSGDTKVVDLDLEKVSSMDIQADFSDVQLIPSDKFAISYSYFVEAGEPSCKVENGLLTFDQFKENRINFDLGGKHDWDELYIKIYYPKDTKFQAVKLDSSAGKIDASGFSGTSVEINADFGDVTLSDISTGTLDLELSAGTCKLTNVIADKLDTDCDFGDLTAKNITTSGMEISMSAGSADISGSLQGTNSIEMDFGDITIQTTGSESQYNLNLNTDFGDVKVNGNKIKDTHIDRRAPNSFEIESSSGSIKLDFSSAN